MPSIFDSSFGTLRPLMDDKIMPDPHIEAYAWPAAENQCRWTFVKCVLFNIVSVFLSHILNAKKPAPGKDIKIYEERCNVKV